MTGVSGRIISQPDPVHPCRPPRLWFWRKQYQEGTVWQCDDCQQVWVVLDDPYGGRYWTCDPGQIRLFGSSEEERAGS